MTATKGCTKCRETLPLERFNRNSRRPDGRRSECKVCESKRTAANRDAYLAAHPAEPEKSKGPKPRKSRAKDYNQAAYWAEYSTRRAGQDPMLWRLSQGRKRARKAGSARVAIFDGLALQDHWQAVGIAADVCKWCGDALDWTQISAHLDHLTPLGQGGDHVPSNLVPSCDGCNQSRPRQS